MLHSGQGGAGKPGHAAVRLLAAGLVVGLSIGCEDVAVNWGPDPQPTPRPAGRAAGRVVEPSHASAPDASAAHASPQTPPTPAALQSEPQPAPRPSPLQVYQLVLFSEPGPAEAPPGIKHVRLTQARARDVANALSLLYLPSGPGGTDHRYTLVYPSRLEAEAAGEAARQLDVGTPTDVPASQTAGDQWRWGVAQTFTVLEDPSVGAERVRAIAQSLAGVVPSAGLSKLQRWSAGLLAGELLAHRLYDYGAAQAVYEQTAGVVEPGSYEQMALLYARVRALQQDGRREEARRLLETIVAQFGALRGSEVFERSRGTLGQWERQK